MGVGRYVNATPASQTLAEQLDAGTWTISSTQNGSGNNYLYGDSCALTTSCMAVGVAGTASLAESWNGSTWSTVATPSGANTLSGVACLSATSCWAAGTAVKGPNQAALLEQYA